MSLRYITMPKWGIEMVQGTLSEWHVSEGDVVEKGQLIALVETDKITNEMESDSDGVMHRIISDEGAVETVGTLLAVIGDADVTATSVDVFIGEFKAADTSMAAGSGPAEAAPVRADVSATAAKPAISAELYTDVNISPAAKRLAVSLGLEPGQIVASGRRGRISLQDVEQAAVKAGLSGSGDGADYTNEPVIETLSPLRQTAARRLTEAKSTIPHFYLRVGADMDALLAKKRSLAEAGTKVSVNDLLIKAAATALVQHPDVNVQIHGDDIYKFPHADISVAVATDRGLVTPVVRSADQRNLSDIAATVRDMAERAKGGKLTHDDMAPGTFTISNLGMFGVDQFDAIINPPQCAILAVGASRRVQDEAAGGFVTRVSLSLSCDHRAIDGAIGAAFLKTLKDVLEDPKDLG